MTPLVTIGMPIYNNAATVTRAIVSIKGQSFSDWRLIATDDGSDDDSMKVARQAADGDPRIETQQNPSRMGHMNFGVSLQAARTEWFVWLAADDYWAPNFLHATLAAAEDRPDAVSVLPRWAYIGLDARAPSTLPLEGTHRERVRQFLAAPGGTRMYGLTRREAMQAAFPPRSFHAYDWFLVLGLIQKGPQIEIPDVLLYRDRTAVRAYVDAAARENPDWLAAWPVLPMSARALKDGRVPMRAIGDLVKLNLRKHEEHLAHRKPEQFTRRIALFRWLGLPIASRPEMTRKIAEELVRDAPDRRKGAAKLLRRLLARGDGDAAYSLGQFQKGGLIDGDARNTFRRGAELGNADAAFEWALLKRSDGDIPEADFWSRIVYAAEGSAAARQFLDEARQSGALPTTLEAVAQHLQAS